MSLLFGVANRSLPLIVQQVQNLDADFKNDLRLLALSLLQHANLSERGDKACVEFKELLKGPLQERKSHVDWREWSQLDWKNEDKSERYPCLFAKERFDISENLMRELHLHQQVLISFTISLN
jgi:hypothetical protein